MDRDRPLGPVLLSGHRRRRPQQFTEPAHRLKVLNAYARWAATGDVGSAKEHVP
jgi:hypothetical protein